MLLAIGIDGTQQKQPTIFELIDTRIFDLQKIASSNFIESFGPGSTMSRIGFQTRRPIKLNRETVTVSGTGNFEGHRIRPKILYDKGHYNIDPLPPPQPPAGNRRFPPPRHSRDVAWSRGSKSGFAWR